MLTDEDLRHPLETVGGAGTENPYDMLEIVTGNSIVREVEPVTIVEDKK